MCGVSAGHVCGHRLILGFPPQSSKAKAMAAVMGVVDSRPLGLRGRASASARAAQEGQPKPGIWGEVPTRTGVALDAVTVQAFDTYGFERMRIGGDRGQRSRVRQPVPRPGRRAHAPGGWGAAGRGLAAGRAGSVGSPAPAAVRLRQRPRDAGNGIDVVADLLGHTSISSSQVYVHQSSAARRSGRGAQPPRADGSSTPVSAPATDARRRRIVAPVRGRVRRACVRRRRGPRRAGRSAGHAGRPRGECGWDPVVG